MPPRATAAAVLTLSLGILGCAACAPADRAGADDAAAASGSAGVEGNAALGAPGGARLEQLSGEVRRTRVAVMPFDVSGAQDTLAYLESALPVLLSQKLSYAAPPDHVFDATDLESARRQALAAGAGMVVMGAVVGDANRLTIQASRRLTKSGRVMAEGSVTGRLDSLDVLTSRLGLQLALWDVDPGGREMIRSATPPVVDAMLDGLLAYRREDGRAAADAFQAALALDSTFGIAAEGLYYVATNLRMSPPGLDRAEVARLVQSLHHRTTASFRAWMEADQDPDSTRRPTVLEDIQRWEAAAAAYPTHPLIWQRLGYLYYWNGAYAGIEDWDQRARHAFRRAAENIGIDVPCQLYDHMLLRQSDPDPTELSEYAESCGQGDGWNPRIRNFNRLLRAAILRDTAESRRILSSAALDSIGDGLPWFLFYFVQPGYGLQEWRAAINRSERNATTKRGRMYSLGGRYHLAGIMGRPGEASPPFREQLASGLLPSDPREALMRPVVSALLEPGWEGLAAEAGYRMVNPDPSWPDTLRHGPRGNNSFDRLCYSEMARLALRDTSQTRASVATLRHLRESRSPRLVNACPELLDAVREGLSAGTETEALTRLDSIMSLAPSGNLNRSVANLVLARLYWARGDAAAAWKWVRRRSWTTHTARIMPAWLRSEGRFAAAVGEREHAIRAYRQYLVLREDPEPVLAPQRDSVLAELACIDPEMADRRDPKVCTDLH